MALAAASIRSRAALLTLSATMPMNPCGFFLICSDVTVTSRANSVVGKSFTSDPNAVAAGVTPSLNA